MFGSDIFIRSEPQPYRRIETRKQLGIVRELISYRTGNVSLGTRVRHSNIHYFAVRCGSPTFILQYGI